MFCLSLQKKLCVHVQSKSPLPNEALEHTGCIFCDPVLQPLVEMKLAKNSRPFRNSAMGGGGRGGRGRGRGRGRGKPRDKMAQLASYFV